MFRQVVAEAERKARQAAELQKTRAADLFAKRATDMADRLTAGGHAKVSALGTDVTSTERRQASLPAEMPSTLVDLESLELAGDGLTGAAETPATEKLLKTIEDLVEKAKQAEEQLAFERSFSKLHMDAHEEKKDQLIERVSLLVPSLVWSTLI